VRRYNPVVMDHPAGAPDSPFDAVLLISFGGPQGPADIRPFLQNVLRGRRVPPERIEEVAHHYERFGGVSPITELTRAQADGLRRRLAARGPALPVYVGMRNWHPFLADTLAGMAGAGIRRALGFILAAHRSWSSCGQYRQNVQDACAEVIRRGGPRLEITYVRDWHDHPGFIAANARHVEDALAQLPPEHRQAARIIFTAHSIPLAMAEASRYREQLATSGRLVAEAAGRRDWALVYQSRSGRPEDPWLEPDINEYLRQEQTRGLTAAVLCPIGFVCDHIEVLYDLDHEAAATCRELHLPVARAAACNDDPLFLDMMADLVRHEADRYAGTRPLPITAPV
jgi:protoporphyrin/coproporphyrin ferrochelatase